VFETKQMMHVGTTSKDVVSLGKSGTETQHLRHQIYAIVIQNDQ